MTVSRSMTQMPLPVAWSIRTLFSLVSLWVTRSGSTPAASWSTRTWQSASRARMKAISGPISLARPITSAARAFSKLA